MLHETAATGAGMRTGRFDAVRGWGDNAGIGQRVLDQIALDLFAGQKSGGVDRAVFANGDAVAVVAQPVDGQFHAVSSSVPMNPPDWRFQ